MQMDVFNNVNFLENGYSNNVYSYTVTVYFYIQMTCIIDQQAYLPNNSRPSVTLDAC